MSDLENSVRAMINVHSAENASNTPDFILARYLMQCLDAFSEAVGAREKWHGRPDVWSGE